MFACTVYTSTIMVQTLGYSEMTVHVHTITWRHSQNVVGIIFKSYFESMKINAVMYVN
jgi:hypothetical protein